MSLLTFQVLLSIAGLELSRVRLYRHQERTANTYKLWRDHPIDFETYQSHQNRRRRIDAGVYLASFVVTPSAETLFVGLYLSHGWRPTRSGDRFSAPTGWIGEHTEDNVIHQLEPQQILSEFSGRLVIDWGLGTRAVLQHAGRKIKPIIEIRRQFKEPGFPGFGGLSLKFADLENLYPTWVSILNSTRGIYLLICNRTGAQYVGSATGDNGFWGRWQQYAKDGHGGNVLMKQAGHMDFSISVLETARSVDSQEDILSREILWKNKLGTRAKSDSIEFRLNRN